MKSLLLSTLFFTLLSTQISFAQNTKNNSSTDFQIIRIEFTTSSNASRELVLGFSDITTDQYDYGYDAQMSNFFPNDFASLLDSDKMVIQAFSEITPTKEVGFVLNSDSNYTYTISISEIQNIDDTQAIYLIDTQENINHDLRASDYNFTASAGEDATRFKLTFSNPALLSVDDNEITDASIFVNGSTNTLFVKQLTSDVESLDIINTLGQTVKRYNSIKMNDLNSGIVMNGFSKGIYIVNLTLENGQQHANKIILN